MKFGKIILLNGTSSSGKSSLAKALQVVLDEPYLHVDGDFFWQMFPGSYFDKRPDEEYRPWRNRFIPACYYAIATMASQGMNVIIDEVLTKPMVLTWLQTALADFEVVFVGLYCGVEELERRERERGNRTIGLARFQYPNIDIHGEYDFEVDTEHDDSVVCAIQIKEVMEDGRDFKKFHLAVEQPLPDFKPALKGDLSMRKVLIFGNSGSGKSTLSKKIAVAEGLAHLDLDTLAWLPPDPPQRAPLAQSKMKIDDFIANNSGWVIEGCYSDLLELAAEKADEIVFLNLDVEQCVANARKRPWEPHKYSSKEAQDANLDMLIDWIRQYRSRTDEFSYQAHKDFFEKFRGKKTMYTENP